MNNTTVMNNATKWLLSFVIAILIFVVAHFYGLITETVTLRWFLTPLAIILFAITVIVTRHNIVR